MPSGLLFPSGVRICHLPQRFHDAPGAQRASRAVHHPPSRHIGCSLGRGGARPLIVVETVRRIVAAEYDEVWGKPKLAARCRAVQLFEQVSPAMAKAQAVLPLECAKQALKGLRGCLHPDLRVGSPCAAAAQAAARSFRKRFGPGADRKIWEIAALILEEAILFGRNDGIDDPVAAAERLERAKVLTAGGVDRLDEVLTLPLIVGDWEHLRTG